MKRNKNPLLEGGKVLGFEMLGGKYFTMKCRLVYPKFWCNCCFVQRKRQEITGDADSSIKLSITSMLLAIKPCSTSKRETEIRICPEDDSDLCYHRAFPSAGKIETCR